MTALLVFARAPVAGTVKTRLAATTGAARALAVYEALLDATLACAAAARASDVVARVELWVAPEGDAATLSARAARNALALQVQHGGDLGARMAHAIAAALRTAPRVLLVGTDCPVLTPAYLAQAAACLTGHDAVIGPAEDGGYVLVGARRPLDFAGVRWSSPHACADTEAAFAAQHATCARLAPLWDVDDEAALARWERLTRDAQPD